MFVLLLIVALIIYGHNYIGLMDVTSEFSYRVIILGRQLLCY